MKQIIAFINEHKDVIKFVFILIKGNARLRALKFYLAFLALLVSGWGWSFHCNNTGNWSLAISYTCMSWIEFGIAIVATIGFYIWLYYDNRSLYLNNVIDGQYKMALRPFYTLTEFEKIYNKHGVSDFEDTEELRKKRQLIVKGGNIRILALSGIGKTYLILRAFVENGELENIYYCDSVNDSQFTDALKYIVLNKPNATIVLDNCPKRICESVIEEYGMSLRVVSAYYDPTDKDRYSKIIDFSDCDIPSVIDRIINNNAIQPMPSTQFDFIKYHSGGIPLMALLLTKAYNENGIFSDISDSRLMDNLLDIGANNRDEQRIAMRTIALFQPFNFDNARSEEARYLINSDYITPIIPTINRETLFVKIADKLLKRGLIERDSVYINMRPQPLACWLVGEWINEQGSFILDIINDLTSYPKNFYMPIVESMARRLEFMQGNRDAENLYEKLLETHDGPFCNEDVICTGIGSRLILAMCTVNPIAVMNCLCFILSNKDIDYLREKLTGDARRNIVLTLEKLCFCKECFENTACLLARLAIAENEEWANNARGQFLQLFHVALAGTENDLASRIIVLKRLKSESPIYRDILLDAIGGAFNYSNLIRTGGAEKFGFIEKHDFNPTWTQIEDYWKELFAILEEWVDQEPEAIVRISEIVCDNTNLLIRSKYSELLFDFIGFIAPKLDNNWDSMYKALVVTRNFDTVSPNILRKIEFWIEKLTPASVLERMNGALQSLYSKRSSSDIIAQEESVVLPYAKEFVTKKLFLSNEVFQLLDNDNGHISWAFIANMAKLLSVEDISRFCDFISDYIIRQNKNYYSSFLVRLFDKLVASEVVVRFAQRLFKDGYHNIAIPILAVIDDVERTQLISLMKDVNNGIISCSDINRYLSAIRLDNVSAVYSMAILLKNNGADDNLLFDHISKYWYLDGYYDDNELMSLYRSVIIAYPLENNNINREFVRLVKETLEKTYDEKFAYSLNKKLIYFLSHSHSFYHIEEIYDVLLTDKYRAIIWKDFAEALTDIDGRVGFFMNVRYTIGSGFGFEEKSLFIGHNDQMKQLCKDFKYGAFVCAAMCPVYDKADDKTGVVNSFHPFVIWLLENYGNQKIVLDEFHANLATYYCTGSSIPVIEDRKRCFENLKSNKNLPGKVYKWIDYCLRLNAADFSREESNEAYIRLAYGKE